MAQHDQVIDNGPGLTVRTDMNAALAALFSSNSGPVQPTVKVQGQFWYDTSTATPALWIRNLGNTAWIKIATLDSVDLGFGRRTTPNRWVWNTKADLTGTDVMFLTDTGQLTLRDILTLTETDGSARAKIQAGIGADPGTTTFTVHDAAGAIVGTMKQSASGIDLYSNGVLRFYDTSNVNRGAISADTSAADGKVTINARNNTGGVDNTFYLDTGGIRVNVGDFYVSDTGKVRARFGSDSNGAMMIYNDTAGVYRTALNLASNGIYLRGITGTIAAMRFLSPTDIPRGVLRFNSENTEAGLFSLYTYQTNGNVQQQMDVDNTGITLKQGASAGDVLTTGNFPNKTTGSAGLSNVDFPIGTDLAFVCATGNEMNRGAAVTMRLGNDNFSYRHQGSGSLLSGTWLNSGVQVANQQGMARRIS
jgi:hypothetical protein